MSDTAKMQRPKFPRSGHGTGRVTHDARGNAIWVRTRADDGGDLPLDTGLALAEEQDPDHVLAIDTAAKRTAPVAAKPATKTRRR